MVVCARRCLSLLASIAALPLLVALTGSPLSARFWNWLMRLVKRGPLPAQLSWLDATRALLGCCANWIAYGLIAAFALAGASGGAYLAQAPASAKAAISP